MRGSWPKIYYIYKTLSADSLGSIPVKISTIIVDGLKIIDDTIKHVKQ